MTTEDLKQQINSMLRAKQMEKMMSDSTFADYLGMSRTWLSSQYNGNGYRPLNPVTMAKLHNKADIDVATMEAYNKTLPRRQ